MCYSLIKERKVQSDEKVRSFKPLNKEKQFDSGRKVKKQKSNLHDGVTFNIDE